MITCIAVPRLKVTEPPPNAYKETRTRSIKDAMKLS